jgi:hypothetical protein
MELKTISHRIIIIIIIIIPVGTQESLRSVGISRPKTNELGKQQQPFNPLFKTPFNQKHSIIMRKISSVIKHVQQRKRQAERKNFLSNHALDSSNNRDIRTNMFMQTILVCKWIASSKNIFFSRANRTDLWVVAENPFPNIFLVYRTKSNSLINFCFFSLMMNRL